MGSGGGGRRNEGDEMKMLRQWSNGSAGLGSIRRQRLVRRASKDRCVAAA